MRLSVMLLPTFLLSLLTPGAVAQATQDQGTLTSWERQMSQTLCSTPCAGQWHDPQLAPDGESVTVAETRGAVTSLWKFSWVGTVKKALIYQGPVLLWTLDLAPALVVLKPDYTLLSYNINQKKVIWNQHLAILGAAPTSLTPLIPGRVLALTNRPGTSVDNTELRDSANGNALQIDPRFQLQPRAPVPQEPPAPVPSADLSVKARAQQGFVAVQLGNVGSAVRLDVYQFFPVDDFQCVACGNTK
ncbi:hypothetical protein ACFFLM_13390 [Deinococcus oregonensis]|uniref:Uncharacterized protein n=1 Tax=Deinococcus oregonensis TaxID=1805970 RepID=A0ABV6B3I2_9DEIO